MKLLKFRKDGCVPCDRLEPKLEEAVNERSLEVEEVNVEDNMDKVREFKVRASPTVVALEDGEEVDRFTGDKDKEKVENFLDNL